MLQVQVVLRRRSTGQMATVLSDSDPDICGEEDTHFFNDEYMVTFADSGRAHGVERVQAELKFDLYH